MMKKIFLFGLKILKIVIKKNKYLRNYDFVILMSEENDVIIKIKRLEKIPVDDIETSNLEARVTGVTKGIDNFAEQIRKTGLIQPIVVYEKTNSPEIGRAHV